MAKIFTTCLAIWVVVKVINMMILTWNTWNLTLAYHYLFSNTSPFSMFELLHYVTLELLHRFHFHFVVLGSTLLTLE
jgi:hypothetical protein